uniref:ATP synthase complex subunit 8 n=1 Tax=Desmognathus wrighti TaxID=52108 RepID=Q644N9_9SALA|nr:ATP synthase F0 subunit 8 [Desmognathus wrighti]AAU20595.1 ATP synthase F0 subunit 8 [Desmognathus wrighti]
MPQLNPNPWFIIFTMAWLIYLVFLMYKIGNLKVFNKPMMQTVTKNNKSWNWPWI